MMFKMFLVGGPSRLNAFPTIFLTDFTLDFADLYSTSMNLLTTVSDSEIELGP